MNAQHLWFNAISSIFLTLFLAVELVWTKKLVVLSIPLQILAVPAFIYLSLAANCSVVLSLIVTFPLCCAILSTITHPKSSSFYQGLCFSVAHLGLASGRFYSKYIFTQMSLLHYALGSVLIYTIAVYVALCAISKQSEKKATKRSVTLLKSTDIRLV